MIIFLWLIVITAFVIVAGHSFFPHMTPGLFVLEIVSTVLGKFATERIKQLENISQFNLGGRRKDLTICLYGYTGSGKTTLIKRTFTMDLTDREKSTQDFKWYSFKVHPDMCASKPITVRIADYKGQRPSSVIFRKLHYISALLLVVDLASRPYGENTDNLLDSKIMVEWLKNDPETKIRERVDKHRDYMSAALIEVLLTSLHNSNLHSVKLIINKFDLLEELLRTGCLNTVNNAIEAREYVSNLFKGIEDNLRQACRDNEIPNFSVHIISSHNEKDVRELFLSLLEEHKKYLVQGR